jgi:hypothetical protein
MGLLRAAPDLKRQGAVETSTRPAFVVARRPEHDAPRSGDSHVAIQIDEKTKARGQVLAADAEQGVAALGPLNRQLSRPRSTA